MKSMKSYHSATKPGISRRTALGLGGAALAAFAVSDPLASAAPRPAQLPPEAPRPKERLRIATCQFPVSSDVRNNARQIRDFMRQAVKSGAHLLHTSEACLSGYAGVDLPSFAGYDWELLRRETAGLRELAKELVLWLVLGSAHFLDAQTKPTNCLYLFGPDGGIVDRYDKSMCTRGDQKHYSAGNHLVVQDLRGVRIGLAICYDICWPQIYMAYRERAVTLMLHSFHNARGKGVDCLDVLNVRQVPTRCADNRMWAVANNSSQPYSHWGSFVARPDATIAQQLAINEPGMLVHDFPDGLSEHGWYHNERPLHLRDDELMSWGQPSKHPRQVDARAEP
jgi:deaminated glutathione amidase